MLNCSHCASPNPPEQKFCGSCGSVLVSAQARSLHEHLDRLTRDQILYPVPREHFDRVYSFKHALTQETVYSSLLHRRRKEVHLATAEALEHSAELHGDELASTLAFHFEQSEEWLRAAHYASRAGDDARKKYAVPEALALYERALSALDQLREPPPLLICEATLGWIELALKTRSYQEQLARLERAEQAARTLNDRRLLARVLHWTTNAHFAQGFNSRAAPAMYELYQLGEDAGDERLSIVPGYYIALFMVDRDPRAALGQLDQVIELARKYEKPDIEAHALATKGFAHARLGEFETARLEIQDAVRFVRTLNSPVKEADVHNLAGFAYFDMGDMDRSLAMAHYGAQKAKSANAVECASAGLMCVGINQLKRQDTLAAQKTFAEMVQLAQTAGSDYFGNFGQGGLATAQFLRGDSAALPLLERAFANAQALGDEYTAAWFAQTLAEIYARSNDVARAELLLRDALAYYRRSAMRPYIESVLSMLITLYRGSGRAAEAHQIQTELNALEAEPSFQAQARTGIPNERDETQHSIRN